MSRLETMLSAIKTRLEGISGGDDYTYTVASVQRWQHTWGYAGQEELVNSFRELPVVLMRTLALRGSVETVDLWDVAVEVDLQFLLQGSAGDVQQVAAWADMMKALFTDYDGWGVGATGVSVSGVSVDPETGMPIDGIHLTLTANYQHTFGDPASRAG